MTAMEAFSHNRYSQFGEDGIIERILERIPDRDYWCVDVGAADGIWYSNTFHFVKHKNYRAVLIEADKKQFEKLRANMASFDVVLLNEFVTCRGRNSLDNILRRTAVPTHFDFLSIDIDGNDYWVFESLELYRPKVVCIEYNPSMPNEIEYVQPQDSSVKRGSSALSICKLATQKGYELVATTFCNLIFVDNVYFGLLETHHNQLNSLRDDTHCRVYAFVGYDGTIIHSRPIRLLWHLGLTVGAEELQCLPRLLRTYPSDYTAFQQFCFLVFLFVRDPKRVLKIAVDKLKRSGLARRD